MNVLLLLLCLGVPALLVLIAGMIAFIRYLAYRETATRAEQGLSPAGTKEGKPLLRWGIVITAIGLVLTLILYPIGVYATDSYPLHLGPWMLGGLVPLFLGLGLLLLHYLTAKE